MSQPAALRRVRLGLALPRPVMGILLGRGAASPLHLPDVGTATL